jgi:hypothetical protein
MDWMSRTVQGPARLSVVMVDGRHLSCPGEPCEFRTWVARDLAKFGLTLRGEPLPQVEPLGLLDSLPAEVHADVRSTAGRAEQYRSLYEQALK